jgi:hypothetical protein
LGITESPKRHLIVQGNILMSNRKKPHGKSAGMKTPATKPAAAKAQSALGEAKPSAGAKSKDNAAKLVRPTLPTSAGQARQAVFEVASDSLQSLIRSNFDALRARLKKAKGEARRDRATSGKADEDFITALNRLEAGYRELLRGK